MKRQLLFSLVAVLMLAATQSAHSFVYSQAYDPGQTVGYNSTRIYSDDFTSYTDQLHVFTDYDYDGTYSITDFHWWGMKAYNDKSPDGFLFRIFADDGSQMPGSMVYSEFISGNAGETYTGYNSGQLNINKYGFNLAMPWSGAAGKYWFSVVGAFTESNENIFFWAQTDDIYGSFDWQYWPLTGNWFHPQEQVDFAFEVSTSDPTVPEPATAWLLGFGILSGGILRRRIFRA